MTDRHTQVVLWACQLSLSAGESGCRPPVVIDPSSSLANSRRRQEALAEWNTQV